MNFSHSWDAIARLLNAQSGSTSSDPQPSQGSLALFADLRGIKVGMVNRHAIPVALADHHHHRVADDLRTPGGPLLARVNTQAG
jgi:hypothetical protein